MRTKWFLVNLQHHVLEVFPAIVFDSDQSKSALGTPQVRIDHPQGQFEGRKGAKRFPLRLLRPLRLIESNRSKGHKSDFKDNLLEPCREPVYLNTRSLLIAAFNSIQTN